MIQKNIVIITFILNSLFGIQKILIPMDEIQTNHLKAYGIAFSSLEKNNKVDWLLNYRGGSFIFDLSNQIKKECLLKNVSYQILSIEEISMIYAMIEQENMELIILEKSPKIAVYSPPNQQPWDDAVTLALTYAEIKYDVIFDDEVMKGELYKYDWLHLHHEDFTGQYGKFYRYRNQQWYKEMENSFTKTAKKYGFKTVHQFKKTIAVKIRDYIDNGGFLFAMCSATDSFDIALSYYLVDFAHSIYDGTPIDEKKLNKVNYNNGIAFENYDLYLDPTIYEYSTIDFPSSHQPNTRSAESDYFTLSSFSAKWDPVPSMLIQNHVTNVNGFMGQTTGYNKKFLKSHVLILGEDLYSEQVKYIHGNVGKGTFTFLGGHDPEDYRHFVGDPPTDLDLHRNSPGYRLILNNILFPAAKKKKKKT
tara:strand:- start:232 stop:1488 length:1257 start_codon:yes stop_codon:yes gene_type:complete